MVNITIIKCKHFASQNGILTGALIIIIIDYTSNTYSKLRVIFQVMAIPTLKYLQLSDVLLWFCDR